MIYLAAKIRRKIKMIDQNPKNKKPEEYLFEVFPYPRIIQLFNYFFPQKRGTRNIFTMENLRKFSRFAPYLTIVILIVIFLSFMRSGFILQHAEEAKKTHLQFRGFLYIILDGVFFIFVLIQYLWWLGVSLFTRLLKRSPAFPLVISFIKPIQAFGVLCLIHFFIFIISGIAGLIQDPT